MFGPITMSGLTEGEALASATCELSCFSALCATLRAAVFSACAAAMRLTDAAIGAIGANSISRDNRQALNTLRLPSERRGNNCVIALSCNWLPRLAGAQ